MKNTRSFCCIAAMSLLLSTFVSCGSNDEGSGGALPEIQASKISSPQGPPAGSVSGGTPITLIGKNFGADSEVRFGEVFATSVEVKSDTELQAITPAVLLSQKVSVTLTTGGQIAVVPATDTTGFLYTPLIAFSSDRTGNFEIFTMSADGTNTFQVTNNALGLVQQPSSDEDNKSPVFSPDGKNIVYVSNGIPDGIGDFEIFIAGRKGTTPTNLTQNGAQDANPAFSPDGMQIVFSSRFNDSSVNNVDGDFEIFRMDTDGGNLTQLTFNQGNDFSPSYSPDGERIVYVSRTSATTESNLFVMDALDGGNASQLTTDPNNDFDPVFSPDGKQIVYVSDAGETAELMVMSSSGAANTGLRQLTTSQADVSRPSFLASVNPLAPSTVFSLIYSKDAEAKNDIYIMQCNSAATVFVSFCDETSAANITKGQVDSDNSPSPSP